MPRIVTIPQDKAINTLLYDPLFALLSITCTPTLLSFAPRMGEFDRPVVSSALSFSSTYSYVY